MGFLFEIIGEIIGQIIFEYIARDARWLRAIVLGILVLMVLWAIKDLWSPIALPGI